MIIIETTQSTFLLKYGATLIVITELFMICTIMVLYATMGAMAPTLIMLFLSPLLGGLITGKICRKYKKVLFKDTFNKYFIILNIILHIIIYLINFVFNFVLVVIYGIGAVIGFFLARKSILNLKNDIEAQKDETFSEGEKIPLKKYKMEKFTTENIKKFLTMNKLEDNNYLIAQVVPTAKEYLLYGYFSFSRYAQYILHFNDEKLYFFELSKLTNKSIENGFVVKFEDMEIKKTRKGLLTYKIRIEFKDGSKANIQILKRVAKMYPQKQYGQKLFNKFIEIKNKSEK